LSLDQNKSQEKAGAIMQAKLKTVAYVQALYRSFSDVKIEYEKTRGGRALSPTAATDQFRAHIQ
jgi:hypothetical protein